MTIKIFKLLTSLPFASLFIKHTECILKGLVGLANDNVIIRLVSKMITNDNKGTYLVKNDQKYDNVIYKWPPTCRPHLGPFSSRI